MFRWAGFCAILAIVSVTCYEQFIDDEFEAFKLEYGKIYDSRTEETFRRMIFFEKKMETAKHNRRYHLGLTSYEKGINKFSDMLHVETLDYHGYRMDLNTKANYAKTIKDYPSIPKIELPGSFDWRSKGAVTRVKDQGKCGSSYAFAAIGSMESMVFLESDNLVEFSEQNVIDCNEENMGCNGGLSTNAFQSIADEGGIESEESYPYVGHKQACKFNKTNAAADLFGYGNIPWKNEFHLFMSLFLFGPISVAIDATHLPDYKSGIYSDPLCSEDVLNHAALVVGYGTQLGKDYWVIKNSWGEKWGMDGYFWLARKQNMCGVATNASYAIPP